MYRHNADNLGSSVKLLNNYSKIGRWSNQNELLRALLLIILADALVH